jgi:hypothetical protein
VQTRVVEGARIKLKSLGFTPSPLGMLTRILLTEPPTEADRN